MCVVKTGGGSSAVVVDARGISVLFMVLFKRPSRAVSSAHFVRGLTSHALYFFKPSCSLNSDLSFCSSAFNSLELRSMPS